MEKIGENRGKSENFGENRGIFEENTRKIGEFSRNSFLNLLSDDPFSRSFSVVFGRFFGHFWRKSENIGEKWRISGKSFRFLSVFFPFHSFLFLLLLKSARFYALQHVYSRYFVKEVECLKYYCYFCT